jgi:hypothetical protein
LRLGVNSASTKLHFTQKARRDSEGAKKDQDATSGLLPSLFAFFLLPFAFMPLVAGAEGRVLRTLIDPRSS